VKRTGVTSFVEKTRETDELKKDLQLSAKTRDEKEGHC